MLYGILDSETSKRKSKNEVKKERKMQLFKEKKGKLPSVIIRTALVIYCMALLVTGIVQYSVPEEITLTEEEINAASADVADIASDVTAEVKLFGKIPIKKINVNVIKKDRLVPCGNVFGVKFFTKGVIVVRLAEIETKNGFVSPAKEAGLMEGDIIQSVNDTEVNTVEEMANAIENSKGLPMTVVYIRDNEEKSCVMNPLLSLSDRKYKTGIWVRDSTAGIGTMTYYNPATGEFAGLGHGICDVDTELLMPLLSGSVVDVEITDIIKGRKGTPGELKGDFDTQKRGSIINNTSHGVYGVMDAAPSDVFRDSMEIALKDELKTGKAKILCELDENGIKEYEIEITKIKNDDENGKNFLISVTDEELLSKTGGIVQGMSGSPIIQNGKLVGAVTHVLVNDPSKGYGIFIENMLAEAEKIK